MISRAYRQLKTIDLAQFHKLHKRLCGRRQVKTSNIREIAMCRNLDLRAFKFGICECGRFGDFHPVDFHYAIAFYGLFVLCRYVERCRRDCLTGHRSIRRRYDSRGFPDCDFLRNRFEAGTSPNDF